MSVLLHIILFKTRILFTLSSELNAKNIAKHFGSLIVFGGFAVGAFVFSRVLTTYLLDATHLGLFLLHRFLSMLLFVLFLSVNTGNIIVSYATFYRSGETAYLLTKPVPHITVFLVKFLDNFFYSSTALFIVVIAVLLGYGSYFAMPWSFYLQTIVLQLVPFMFIAGCLAVVTLMVMMRIAQRKGIWNVIGILLLLYVGSLFVYFKSTNPLQLVNSVMHHYPNVDRYFSNLDPVFARFLPNHWIAESLYWTMRGNSPLALLHVLFMVSVAGAVFVGTMLAANKLFYPSWLSSLALRCTTEERESVFGFFSLTQSSRFDLQTSVMIRKEFWQFIREPSQWIHLGVVLLLVVTFTVSVSRLEFSATLPTYLTVSYLTLLVFNAFLIASVALRFVYPMISIEGESFWTMLSAPLDRTKIYLVKFCISFLPLSIASLILIVFSHWSLQGYSTLLPFASLAMICTSVALVSLNLTAGAYFSDFRERNPIKVASSQGATLTFLISILYLTILVAVMFVPLNIFFFHSLKGGDYRPDSLWFALAAFVVVSLSMSLLSIVIGFRTLRRDF